MTKKALEIMNKITTMNAEIEKLEKELLHELTPKIGDIMEQKSKINIITENAPESENKSSVKSEDSLKNIGLSDAAMAALKKIGREYIYDVEDGISESTIKFAVGKNFKLFKEIVSCFEEWGIAVDKDLGDDGFKLTDVVEDEINPTYNKAPYNIKIKDLKLPVRVRNALIKNGYGNNKFYTIYMMPKKKLLKECSRFGKTGYTALYNFIKDQYGVVMETP